MSRPRPALLVFGLAIVASQAGHLVAYQLRYGQAALQIQSSGAHAYLPALVKTGLGLAALVTLLALLGVGFARLAVGRPVEAGDAPRFLRLLAILFSLQLTFFVVQESLEAALSGAPASSAEVILLWGTLGQLPVAVLAALALRWLLVQVAPALAQLGLRVDPTSQPVDYAIALVAWPVAADVVGATDDAAAAFNRRGPPSF